MYDELVKRLREEADCPDNYPEDSNLMREAADAIEEYEFICNRYEKDYKALCAYLPKWIPVTERLPEQNGKYRAFALGEENTMNFYDGHWMLYGTDYRRYVTHWMPLSLPPEEETC